MIREKNVTDTPDDLNKMAKSIHIILDMWEDFTMEEIATKIGVRKQRVQYFIGQLRKNGYMVPRKKSAVRAKFWAELVHRIETERK